MPPSPVSNDQRPAFFRPQNHVRANLSPSCAVTTLSHPVVPLEPASAAFFLLLPARVLVQMALPPAAAPMPPSRFMDEAMQVIGGALRSSNEVPSSEDPPLSPSRPHFFALLTRVALAELCALAVSAQTPPPEASVFASAQ